MKEAETVQHIICCCEALARQRFNVLGVWLLNRQTYAQPQLGTFASSYEALGYGIWAEYSTYLELHNKPTAVVLTGAFMLTGPRGGGGEEVQVG
jgi:hypothetical protein